MAIDRPPMALVGAGVVAQTLGRLLASRGEPLIAVAGRNRARTEHAARFVGGSVRAIAISEVPLLAAHILVAVTDEAITPVAEALASAGLRAGTALHTCGGKGPEALAPLRAGGTACGVLHPLQTLATPEQGVVSMDGVTFGLAGDSKALEWAERLVRTLGGQTLQIDSDRLSYYHAGAVMASGALVAALDAAVSLFERAGIERNSALRALGPLARTSLDNVLMHGPEAALTGPVRRGDAATVAAHLSAVAETGAGIAPLYRAVTEHALSLAQRNGLGDPAIRAVRAVLEADARGRFRQSSEPLPTPAHDAPCSDGAKR